MLFFLKALMLLILNTAFIIKKQAVKIDKFLYVNFSHERCVCFQNLSTR